MVLVTTFIIFTFGILRRSQKCNELASIHIYTVFVVPALPPKLRQVSKASLLKTQFQNHSFFKPCVGLDMLQSGGFTRLENDGSPETLADTQKPRG